MCVYVQAKSLFFLLLPSRIVDTIITTSPKCNVFILKPWIKLDLIGKKCQKKFVSLFAHTQKK